MALVAAAFGGRDQWFDIRPFIVGQVTRISQFAAVVTSAVLRRPHRGAPLESGHHFESQTIQRIQNVFGRTLRGAISSFRRTAPQPRSCSISGFVLEMFAPLL